MRMKGREGEEEEQKQWEVGRRNKEYLGKVLEKAMRKKDERYGMERETGMGKREKITGRRR